MKKIVFLIVCTMWMNPVWAQSVNDLSNAVDALRDDFAVMQRKIYETGGGSDAVARLSEMDEAIRNVNGRMETLEFRLKKIEERIDLINKDIDARISLIEGKPIEGSGATSNLPKTFDAPVAVDAPQSLTGDSVNKGAELEPISSKNVQDTYQRGLDELKDAQYDKAEATFTSILNNYPTDQLAGNAQYWLGEVYYGKKDYTRAAVAFAKGYQNYKTSTKGADSLLKLGMSMKALGKNPEACAAFMSMDSEFPNAFTTIKEKSKQEAGLLKCK